MEELNRKSFKDVENEIKKKIMKKLMKHESAALRLKYYISAQAPVINFC